MKQILKSITTTDGKFYENIKKEDCYFRKHKHYDKDEFYHTALYFSEITKLKNGAYQVDLFDEAKCDVEFRNLTPEIVSKPNSRVVIYPSGILHVNYDLI